jgi:threonine/homoserine/homoserine lactone efflux protein
MIEAHWLLFFSASIAVIATPGQDMILVMSKALSQGTRAGVTTAAGVSVGLLGHTLLATLGLGAVLGTSEWLFVALKFVGATYLAYLGVQLLLTRSAVLTAAASARHPHWQLFMTGAASNISNTPLVTGIHHPAESKAHPWSGRSPREQVPVDAAFSLSVVVDRNQF